MKDFAHEGSLPSSSCREQSIHSSNPDTTNPDNNEISALSRWHETGPLRDKALSKNWKPALFLHGDYTSGRG